MNPTTTAPAASPGGGDDARTKYARRIEDAFEAAGQLAGSALPPTDFYREFLNRTLSAIDAPAGAVWLRTPQGFLQLACQENIDKMGLDTRRGARQCHNEVLRQVFQSAPPRPLLLEPNGRMPPGPGEPGPVPPANLTDHFTLFAPIVTPDKQTLGILEVFQDPAHDPRMYATFLNYTFQMAGYASQYHSFSNARVAAGIEKTYAQVESFARQIHSSLNPTEVAYHVANEGRKLIECDRLCVGVRHDRRRVTVEAVSGADVVEKASTHVRRLRLLMQSVLAWGETLTFKGEKDPGLPPDVSAALDDYLHESQPKLLIVQPVRDEREKDGKKPARGVLVLEHFNPPEQIDTLVQRLEIVTKHAAPALYNAAEMKRVPLKFLWWPIAKVQDGLGGKSRFIAASVAVLLALLTAAMVLVPAPLRMEAKGQMLPVEIAKIYPPGREGVVREVRAKPGQQIDPGYELVVLESDQLADEYTKARNEWLEQSAMVTAYSTQLQRADLPKEERTRIGVEKSAAEARVRMAQSAMDGLDRQYNAVGTRPNSPGQPNTRGPGYFRAIAPDFDPKLARELGRSRWTVLNDDKRESLLGRTMRPNEEIMRIGHLDGPWQLELKIPQRNVGQVLRAFADPARHLVEGDPVGGRKYLDVDVLLSSETDTRYRGRLYRDDLMAEAVPNKNEHDENEPVVTAYVKLNVEGIPAELRVPREKRVTGLEVRTRIRCGDHALGYTLFHGVWEWFYEKVVFFF